ncbi:MAG: FAD-dependent oxidoreductase [Kiritimatiellae bacterium]|jgi:hypothetical protein|nr:FAD-dependent oxidoreductase [Kiritimatiellia bacterium]
MHFEEIIEHKDVLVVGGGTAGVIAAIQSARAGANTILVERVGQLGGAMTTGGVAFPGLFHAWGEQVIAGIGWELVSECVKLDGGTFPDFTDLSLRHWKHQFQLNQYLYALLAEEKCLEAGVSIVYYETPCSIESSVEGWLVETCGSGVKRTINCKQMIDCTGGADIVGMIGLPRLREEETQPGSMLYKSKSPYLPGEEQLEAVYVLGADSSTSATQTRANIEGRNAILKKIRESGNKLTHLQPEATFRESYRILGETVITHDDYVSGRKFDDAICYAFYPVDLHSKDGVKPKYLEQGVVPTIPLSALIPKDSNNIIVAGRCVSSDRLANSGLRVQASCMAMGQAAGATAALAAQSNSTPLDVPLEDVKNLLVQHQAIVPDV